MNFPEGFEKLLNASLPEDETAPLLDSLDWPAHTSVRLNPGKNVVLHADYAAGNIPWHSQGFLLKERPLFAADPAFHSGHYYVQEGSSMLVAAVFSALRKQLAQEVTVLDLCAAPGGKSTLLAEMLQAGDMLMANEVIQSRTPILHENLCKWGHGNHIITRADARDLGQCKGLFDVILADMPCSGEGLFRKDEASLSEWSENNVGICCGRQQRIAADIWPALAEGGYFIYSTCTYNHLENEDNIQWICENLGAELVEVNLPVDWNIYSQLPGTWRMMPHRNPGEGFFLALLRKKSKVENTKEKRVVKFPFTQNFNSLFREKVSVYEWKNEWYFHRSLDADQINKMLSILPAVYAPGTPLGRSFEKGFKPDPALALSVLYQPGSFPEIELNHAEIIKYYRRESLPNSERKQGIHLVKWNGKNMGFANGVKHQWNNLWPMEWRLRKEGLDCASILE